MLWNPSPGGSGGTFNVYTALLTQAGVGAPSETILFDTVTGIVWTRLLAGIYQGTKVGAFQVAKTYAVAGQNVDQTLFTGNGAFVNCRRTNNNTIELRTYAYDLVGNTYTLVDGALLNTPVEVRVYP